MRAVSKHTSCYKRASVFAPQAFHARAHDPIRLSLYLNVYVATVGVAMLRLQLKQLEEHKKLALKLDQIAEQNDSRVEQFAKLLEAKELECQLLTAKLNHQTQLTALEQKKAEGVALEMAQLKTNEAILKVCVHSIPGHC